MNRRHVLSALMGLPSFRAAAQLEVGAMAPDFSLRAALDGREFRYSLSDALAKGPVVLYFFPAAYSEGCSVEAHTFAEAMADFNAAGASVVGVSADDMQTLSLFSKQACQGKFPVASDADQRVMRAYDAAMRTRPEYATRVSFVIARDGSIVFTYKSLEPTRHVAKTLAAVRQLAGTPAR